MASRRALVITTTRATSPLIPSCAIFSFNTSPTIDRRQSANLDGSGTVVSVYDSLQNEEAGATLGRPLILNSEVEVRYLNTFETPQGHEF
ncbi:MAG: hypothetical protein ACREBG_02580 [Pyrinomonadaceae bacterium]